MTKNKKISIIIKAKNEKENIAKSIASAIRALKGMNGEIILADSVSTDGTIEIAKKYPIKIVQLVNPEDSSCGMGAQLGYMHSSGDYVHILDGDMELNEKFIQEGIKELDKENDLAGVGGIITEMTDTNIIFRRRKTGSATKFAKPYYPTKLMMGGLYKRELIEKVGYFANPNLHAYEESDLGMRLTAAGYKMKRIPVPMVRHYGDKKSSFAITMDRWKSKYLFGCGELLRYHIGKPTFFNALKELKIYILVILWWILLFAFLSFYQLFQKLLLLQLASTFVFLIFFLMKKRNLSMFLFSVFSWNITALAIILGFLQKPKNIHRKIESVKIKW